MKIYSEEQLPQGSEEWLKIRRLHGTASEAASVLQLSPWTPKTPLQLWQVKNGKLHIKMNEAMKIGSDTEDEARECFEKLSGKTYIPVCITDEIDGLPLMASLDGMERGKGNSILEIKVPLNGSCSPLWANMELNEDLPIHYVLQMQQQMLLSKQSQCNFWVYDRKNKVGLHRIVKQDKKVQQQIIDGWAKYFEGKPEAGDKDVIMRDDKEWCKLAMLWKMAKSDAEEATKKQKELRQQLIDLCDGKSYKGNQVQVTKNNQTGGWSIRKVK